MKSLLSTLILLSTLFISLESMAEANDDFIRLSPDNFICQQFHFGAGEGATIFAKSNGKLIYAKDGLTDLAQVNQWQSNCSQEVGLAKAQGTGVYIGLNSGVILSENKFNARIQLEPGYCMTSVLRGTNTRCVYGRLTH